MKRKPFHFSSISIAVIALLIVGLQAINICAQLLSAHITRHNAIDTIERRIILDSAFLDIGNETLNTPVNAYAVNRYLNDINTSLKDLNYPVRVKSIQHVEFNNLPSSFSDLEKITLDNAEQTITVQFASLSLLSMTSFSFLSLIAALVISPLFYVKRKVSSLTENVPLEVAPPTPKLVINLRDKTLGNGVNKTTVILQNKPLCFYTALVNYCTVNPNEPLPPHKDVPAELLMLANKTFARLIELGHTKRKRPDFNANLDKTLSEIRAALDEVFAGFTEEKETFYPPRAQGEGSRSKQHSYALSTIKIEDVEIIGN